MNDLNAGAWAGALATGVMTLGMFSMHDELPQEEKSPLPPAVLTDELLGLARPKPRLSASARQNLSMLNHFAYGVSCGAVYSLAVDKRFRTAGWLKGLVFGGAVWAASYLGWIPAAGFRPAATRMPFSRNAIMIAAHAIWGASLGASLDHLKKNSGEMLDGSGKAREAE